MSKEETQLKEAVITAAIRWRNSNDVTELTAATDALIAHRTQPGWEPTYHAITQYMRRSGMASRERAAEAIVGLMRKATRLAVKERYRVLQLINHNFEDAEYWTNQGWVFVVKEGRYIVTVHNGQAKRWKKELREIVEVSTEEDAHYEC